MDTNEVPLNSIPGRILAWMLTVLVSAACLNAWYALFGATSIYQNLFKGLGVELPLATKILLATYVWLYPILFGGAAILLFGKEFIIRETRSRLAATGIVFLFAAASIGLVQYVLYLPPLDLIRKLGQAK
jgi:hypothetical protein